MLRAALRSAKTYRSHFLDDACNSFCQARTINTRSAEQETYQITQPRGKAAFLAGFFDAAPTPHTVCTADNGYSGRDADLVPSTSKLPPLQEELVRPAILYAQDRTLLRALWRLQKAITPPRANEGNVGTSMDALLSKMERLDVLLQEASYRMTPRACKRAIRILESLSGLLSGFLERGQLSTQAAQKTAGLLIRLANATGTEGVLASKRITTMTALAAAYITLRYQTASAVMAIEQPSQVPLSKYRAYLQTKPAQKQHLAFLEHIKEIYGITGLLPFLEEAGFDLLSTARPGLLEELTRKALEDPAFMKTLGGSLRRSSARQVEAPFQSRKIWALHVALFHRSLTKGGMELLASRLYGPSDSQMNVYMAIKFLLSSWIIRVAGKSRPGEREELREEQARELIHSLLHLYRHLHLPPDRQVMSAVLHAVHGSNVEHRGDLHSYLGWIWQEWTIRRESDSRKEEDDCLLLGFLDVTSKEDSSAWQMQALVMAVSKTGIQSASAWGGHPASMLDDRPEDIPSGMVRAIALAALRLESLETTMDCLFDYRLSSSHAFGILYELTRYLDKVPASEEMKRVRLAHIIATFIRQQWQRDPPNFSTRHPHRLVPVILALFRYHHFREAVILLRTLHSPVLIGSHNLNRILEILIYHRRSRLALAIFHRISVQQLDENLWNPLLRSMDHRLSDRVWQTLLLNKCHITTATLNARLTHYVKAGSRRYKQALRDYQQHQQTAKPDTITYTLLLNLHVKAGKQGGAWKAYSHIRHLPDAPANLVNHILPILGTQRAGPTSSLRRAGDGLERLIADGQTPDGVTANIVLRDSLKWGELDNEGIWAALRAGLLNTSSRSWQKEIRPLFRMVIRAFLARGNKVEARKVVVMMAQDRDAR